MWTVYLPAHNRSGLEVFQRSVGLTGAKLTAGGTPSPSSAGGAPGAAITRSPQRLCPATATPGSERDIAVEPTIKRGSYDRTFTSAQLLPAVAKDVVILVGIIKDVGHVIVDLALPAGCAEVAFLALAPAADTWRITGVIDGTQITPHLATTAGNTCLINPLVLGSCSRRRRSTTARDRRGGAGLRLGPGLGLRLGGGSRSGSTLSRSGSWSGTRSCTRAGRSGAGWGQGRSSSDRGGNGGGRRQRRKRVMGSSGLLLSGRGGVLGHGRGGNGVNATRGRRW